MPGQTEPLFWVYAHYLPPTSPFYLHRKVQTYSIPMVQQGLQNWALRAACFNPACGEALVIRRRFFFFSQLRLVLPVFLFLLLLNQNHSEDLTRMMHLFQSTYST